MKKITLFLLLLCHCATSGPRLEKQIKEQKKVQQELEKQIQIIIKELERARAAKAKEASKSPSGAPATKASPSIASI